MNTRKRAPDIRHKHLEIDQNKLDLAKAILGTTTERETIEKLLDRAIVEDTVDQVERDMVGIGGIEDLFGMNSMGLDPASFIAKKKRANRQSSKNPRTRR